MELTRQMVLFARAVDAGSFSGAARDLGQSPSAVSRQVQQLEDYLGIRLLTRSAKGISLTNEGVVFYERCVEIRRDVARALDLADTLSDRPRGRLGIVTTVAFGKSQLLPVLPEFLDRYPEVQIDLDFSDRPVDFAKSDCDIAIQFAEQIEDESLIARKLAPNRRVVCASPDYVRRFGGLRSPSDLAQHNVLRLSTVMRWNNWLADLCNSPQLSGVPARFEANSADAIYHAALAGIGVARLPTYLICDDLAANRLVNLLPGYVDDTSNIYAVYPMKRNLSPRVRVFISYLVKKFGAVPPWERKELMAHE